MQMTIPWWTSIVVALLAAAGALIAAAISARLTLKNQVRLAVLQNRQKAYAAIHGSRVFIAQLLVSRTEARVHSDYHEALWRMKGYPDEDPDYKEAHRFMVKASDLALEIGKAKQSLCEAVGLAQASFPHSPRLSALTEKVYRLPGVGFREAPQGDNLAALIAWKAAVIPAVQKWVQENHDDVLIALCDELRQALDAPS